MTPTGNTLSGNSTAGDDSCGGGGILTRIGDVTLTSSTVFGNRSNGEGEGILLEAASNDETLTVTGFIVAGNSDTGDGSHPNLFFGAGTTADIDSRLIGNSKGVEDSLLTRDPDAVGSGVAPPTTNAARCPVSAAPLTTACPRLAVTRPASYACSVARAIASLGRKD